MAPTLEHPYYPIVYVRGYAMTASEIEDTVATPYMGFNLGSTKVRQRWTGEIERLIFESPLVRLMKDHGYRDAYANGGELLLDPDPPRGRKQHPRPDEPPPIPARSVIIYRYYEHDSKDLNPGVKGRRDVEEQAAGLSSLIHQLREQVCRRQEDGAWVRDEQAWERFKVYLVAHSMGGLVCRCFLQNPKGDPRKVKNLVDKVFTYATPHDGIGAGPLSTVPAFLGWNKIDNFSRPRMAEYLALAPTKKEREKLASVASLNGKFPPERFFCLVGTNARDYRVAFGASAALAGEMSDGLVRIANAAVEGAPRAFVHRSHSGHYGIVNSEEGYQNLVRFLFGDLRVDGRLQVDSLSLPPSIQRRKDKGDSVRGSYHLDCVVAVRGGEVDLHRRVTGESSAVFAQYDELVKGPVAERRRPHLFSLFLSSQVRKRQFAEDPYEAGVDEAVDRRSLGFSVSLRVHVPLFEVGGSIFDRERFPNASIFDDTLELRLVPPAGAAGAWSLRARFSAGHGPAAQELELAPLPSSAPPTFAVPIRNPAAPGIEAQLLVSLRPWNAPE